MRPLLDLVLEHIPGPEIDADSPLRMLVTTLDWSNYLGRIGVGRIHSGVLRKGQTVAQLRRGDRQTSERISQLFVFDKLGRAEVEEATAGDVAAIVGLDDVEIGDTIADPENPAALAAGRGRRADAGNGFFDQHFAAGRARGQVPHHAASARAIATRMERLEKNVALRVREIEGTESFAVSGRGLLHLSVLIETMRREGYELSVGKPKVILHHTDSGVEEPFENLIVEVPADKVGAGDGVGWSPARRVATE